MRIGKLLLPRILGSAVYQLSVLIDTVLASLGWIVGAGGVAALYYSHRLVHLPLALFGISLATAVLPRMAKEVALNDIGKLKETVNFSLKTVFFAMIPAAVGLMVLAGPIIKTLFQRGEFTSYSTLITSSALFYYSFGLVAYAGIKILVNVYYSMGDTATPVKIASISLVVNLLLNLILMWPLKVGGLALATSIAATVNFFMLFFVLNKKIGYIGGIDIFMAFIKNSTAGIIMAFFTYFLSKSILVDSLGSIKSLMFIFLIIILSAFIYTAISYASGVEMARRAWNGITGRKN